MTTQTLQYLQIFSYCFQIFISLSIFFILLPLYVRISLRLNALETKFRFIQDPNYRGFPE
jgi:hypothetical protein